MESGGNGRPGTCKKKTTVKFNGLSRTYRLHVPSMKATADGWPLLVVLHGAFNTAAKTEQETGFSDVADEQGFLVAYANGIGIFGLLQHWNAGHCCGKAAKDDVDDVAYIDAVIHDTAETCSVNRSRIYIVGHSNGGMMAYRYVMERAGKIAAAAVYAGALNSTADEQKQPWIPPAPSRPVPMLIMHGRDDRHVPPGGGESPFKKDGRIYTSVDEAAGWWIRQNAYSLEPEAEILPGADSKVWKSTANGSEVQLILLNGWGHSWPGPFFTGKLEESNPLHGFNASELMWNFLSRFPSGN